MFAVSMQDSSNDELSYSFLVIVCDVFTLFFFSPRKQNFIGIKKGNRFPVIVLFKLCNLLFFPPKWGYVPPSERTRIKDENRHMPISIYT